MKRALWLLPAMWLAACTPMTVAPPPAVEELQAEVLPEWQPGWLASLEASDQLPVIVSLCHKAELARQQQNWNAAMTWLDQARQIQPRNAAVLYRQAWVLLQKGELLDAEGLLQRGLMFAQDKGLAARMQLLRAETLQRQGRDAEALMARRQALQLDPVLLR